MIFRAKNDEIRCKHPGCRRFADRRSRTAENAFRVRNEGVSERISGVRRWPRPHFRDRRFVGSYTERSKIHMLVDMIAGKETRSARVRPEAARSNST